VLVGVAMLNYALPVLLALAGIAQASPPSVPSEDGAKVQIEPAALPVDEHVTGPTAEPAEPSPPAAATPLPSGFTLDTPIATLIADPAAKAVLDRDLPGLTEDANLPKFEGLSLREFQPLTGGQLDDALLAKVGDHLGGIGSASAEGTKPKLAEGR
jgi:hypothetical protein